MKSKNFSIDERLLRAGVAINNALNDAGIQNALAVFGYDANRINEGKTLLEAADNLVKQHKKEYGEQYEATGAFKAALNTADRAYMKSLKVARIAFTEKPDAQTALMLYGIRKRTLSGWIQQAESFYKNLLADADFMAQMAVYGYTQEKLEAELSLVQAVSDANLAQEKEKGEAQQATYDRDAKMDELDKWMSDFVAIARIALDENPQWLEKMGIVEPS